METSTETSGPSSAVGTATLEIVTNGLTAIANRIAGRLIHAARAHVIKEAEDCSAAVFDVSGQLLAESDTVPILRNAIRTCVETILRHYYPLESWREGDLVITNDPYAGGESFTTAHTNDFCTIRPIFWDGRIVAFAGMVVHHQDIGSRNMAGQGWNENIYQEGVRIPPLKIVRENVLDGNLMAVILNNSRVPDLFKHDLTAQITCNGKAQEDVEALFAKYGAGVMESCFRQLIDNAEKRTRIEIGKIPDGVYRAEIPIMDDGAHGGPYWLRVAVTKKDTDLTFDFTGTDGQIEGPINAPLATVWGAVLFTLRCMIDPTIPSSEGCIRPITIIAPPGTLVNAKMPAAVWQRMLVCQSLIDLIMKAMSQAGVDRAIADSAGVQYDNIFSMSPLATPLFIGTNEAGGNGASALGDGISIVTPHLNNCPLPSVETFEAEYPLRYLKREIRCDSGGPGRHRGGLGGILKYEVLEDGYALLHACQKFRHLPEGRHGGLPGAGSLIVLNEGTDREVVVAEGNGMHIMRKGDTVTHYTPGGGGYGPPAERDRAAVRADVDAGYVTPKQARHIYGLAD